MKKILLLGALFCTAAPLLAQKVFFIFIQSDAGTPFYVKMNEKVLSSTASGYLIVPKLKDSTYIFQLGPAPSEGELRFEVAIVQKDRGFLLKKFAEGWGLFDLQTMSVTKPLNAATGFSNSEKIGDNPFVQLLSKASGDTSLLYQPVLVSQTAPVKKTAVDKPSETVAAPAIQAASDTASLVTTSGDAGAGTPPAVPVVTAVVTDTASKNDALIISLTEQPITVVAVPEVSNQQPAVEKQNMEATSYKRSVVMRRAESSTVDGFGLVFWDKMEDATDTIKIFIPNQKISFGDKETVTEPMPVVAGKKDAAACNGAASEKDFFRVRKNIVAFDSEEKMVAEAKDNFRKKCFTAVQIKNLSALFLTQQGKWLFLEAAYPFVSDKENFGALQSELYDDAYIARFKALTNQ